MLKADVIEIIDSHKVRGQIENVYAIKNIYLSPPKDNADGMEIMKQMGMEISTIKAGHANMFLNPLFCRTLAAVTGATIELYETDGSVGAAYGAGIGAGIYKDSDEAFKTLKHMATIKPEADSAPYKAAYKLWVERLGK